MTDRNRSPVDGAQASLEPFVCQIRLIFDGLATRPGAEGGRHMGAEQNVDIHGMADALGWDGEFLPTFTPGEGTDEHGDLREVMESSGADRSCRNPCSDACRSDVTRRELARVRKGMSKSTV